MKQPIIYSGLVEGVLHFAMQPFSDEPSVRRIAYWRDTNACFASGVDIDRHYVFAWYNADADAIAWLLDGEVSL